ncbi:hypothetical protein DV736_g3142, partial [Chaetothyriales sp. CBS 134916]
MAFTDPFDELLQLENKFYKEGYDAGVADSAHAGLVEGKVFGIEKGYEKALELGRIYGRALVWSKRLTNTDDNKSACAALSPAGQDLPVGELIQTMPRLPNNARLRKNINSLLALTDPVSLPRENSDESVSDLDGRIVKARAKAKMIATMIGETVATAAASTSQPGVTGIEDSTGLNARH